VENIKPIGTNIPFTQTQTKSVALPEKYTKLEGENSSTFPGNILHFFPEWKSASCGVKNSTSGVTPSSRAVVACS